MKPVANPIRNNSRRFFIVTSNKTAKSYFESAKAKINWMYLNTGCCFFSPKRLFLGKVSVVKSFKSRNFNGLLLNAERQEPSLKLFGLARQRDWAVTSARRDADWSAEVSVGAFSPWRRIYTPARHPDHIKHTLVLLCFRERPLIL